MAPLSLIDILSNEYLLLSTTPYLLPTELLNLALSSRSYYGLITHSRSVWRHLNLSKSPRQLVPARSSTVAQRSAVPRYQTDVLELLERPFVLRDVKTLVLDGLPVTSELLHVLLSPRYRIQVLSIRECSQINEGQLMLQLQYLIRPSRAADSLSLRGVYYFGAMDAPGGIFPSTTSTTTKSHDLAARGRFITTSRQMDDWVGILQACAGIIAFDTRLCTGPRHGVEHEPLVPKIASIRLGGGCASCGSSPEAKLGRNLPNVLIPPVPLTTSDIRVACRGGGREKDILRCEICVQDRWCARCGKWWCESCAAETSEKKLVSEDCYECGSMCSDCSEGTSRTCKSCRGEYCIIHNEGADNVWCEWCHSSERRLNLHRQRQIQQQQQCQYTNAQQRARTLARLNALRASMGFPGTDSLVHRQRQRCMVNA